MQTESYRLAAGESIKSVAKRHGLTVTELKKLNQLRTFHKPFTALGAGDEIDVPKSQSGHLLAESLTQAAAAESPVSHTENNTERWLASTASRAAGMLKGGNVLDSAKSQLRGMAMSEANQTVQNWLQRYGTVKLQANVDDRGRLDGSQFDMLLPLYDTEKQMAFTQFGLRHIDSRTTANFGLGQRHFFDTGIFGYNAFLDHDITRDHTRFGLGAEYARDFMKFGANGYFRASGWKDGKKLKDYEERPANGFDLRAEGYVPSYPQLGGKLIYEQYFGDEVGLLSEERRQKDPAAFTLGASYTPIPLVTLGLDRRQSTSGGGETLFNLGLNYEIGTPWSKQVDPDAVAFKRSLQGGRYDLVERNNQIVLEYRKKNLIRLMMENRINGRGGAVIPLNVNVSAQHGLKEIVWDTAGLVAGGSKLDSVNAPARTENLATEPVRGGTRYLLTLPPFHDKGNNTYTLSGIAYDTQGNASERMETLIQVVSSAVNPGGSGFEPAEKSMVADGKTQTVIRLKLTDKDGKPVSGVAGNLKLTDDKTKLTGDGKDPELGTEVKEVPEGSGIYKVKVKAGDKTGQWKITTRIDGKPLDTPTEITFGSSKAELIDPDKSEFIPEKGELPNEGDTTVIKLNLKDKDGNPITGAENSINLIPDNHELYGQGQMPTTGTAKEVPPGSGTYEIPVTAGAKKGKWTLTPEVFGKPLKRPATLTFGQSLADVLDTQGSTIEPADGSNALAADGVSTKTLRVVLKDKQGKPVTGAKDSIRVNAAGQLPGEGKDPQIGDVKEVSDGVYEIVVTAGQKTGNWTLTTTVDGTEMKKETVIEFDENKAPAVNNLQLNGILHINETLHALYQFEDKGGNTTDRSFYVWGDKGTTAKRVIALADAAGVKEPVLAQKNGESRVAAGAADNEKVKYVIERSDAGKVLEVSILAANEANLRAKAPVTTDITDPAANRGITGGNGKGGVADPDAKPQVQDVELSGQLVLPTTLTARYLFAPNGGDATDKSRYAWAAKDQEGTKNWQDITDTSKGDQKGQALITLEQKDQATIAGKVLAISILPVNGVGQDNQEGIVTVTTAPDDPANKTQGGGQDKDGKRTGTVVNPDAKPNISVLILDGNLEVGEELTAIYTFDANTGDPKDYSEYTWYRMGSLEGDHTKPDESSATPISPAAPVPENGRVQPYKLTLNDVHKFIEIRVQPMHGGQPTGKLLKVNSSLGEDATDGNEDRSGGGNGGLVIDPDSGPKISDLELKLSASANSNVPVLTGTYRFDAGTGNTEDKSRYNWMPFSLGQENPTKVEVSNGQEVEANQDHNQQPHRVPDFTLKPEHAGQLIGLSIQGRNGSNITNPNKGIGNTESKDTSEPTQPAGVNPDGTIKGVAGDFTITSDKPEKDADGTMAVKVERDKTITLTVKTEDGGQAIGGVPVTIKMTAINRQKKSDTVTVNLDAKKGVLAGKEDTYRGHTDENGHLVINVTDPNGIGTRTTLSVEVNDGANKTLTKTWDVIFTVLTSPDTPKANYWGHMEETVNDGSNTFYRPFLAEEINATEYFESNNENWGIIQWNRASNYCQNNLSANPPTIAEAKRLAEFNLSSADHYLYTHYGWPVNNTVVSERDFNIWTSEPSSSDSPSIGAVGLNNNIFGSSGSNDPGGGGNYILICRK
ncbi:inverse autotransporter beta domain-containing protein [Xenorhabdus bovienii]|uniref:inverse autotransporter beta domain-containing protein n=1 Tax=Xenorhabdus bovienii TaxID=40576 RepID=UPI0023B28410|nr:inverse autotransporter beta domain-containing protein [Xenorhabdus bovienii]MDE9516616.1 inverse autotransporter beta domain-containing protein [Xenorhabdus bovienii]